MGLDFRAVQADTGSIGGSASHEFQVLAQSGEDDVIFSDSSDYAANIEFAEALAPKAPRAAATEEMTLVDTPHAKTIAELVGAVQPARRKNGKNPAGEIHRR